MMNNEDQILIDEQSVRGRTRKMNRKKILFITLSSVIIILLIAIIVYVVYYKLNHVSFEEQSMYQYFSGVRVDYEGTLTLAYDGKVTNLEYNDIEIESDSTPIYYAKIDNKVFFPASMELVTPRLRNVTYKINYFSEISIEKYEDQILAYLSYRNGNYELEDSFIYDGDNLYFLTYGATLDIDGKTIELSPLSYAIVNFGGDVEFYNYATNNYRIIESPQTDVKATLRDCVLNMSTDSLIYNDGSSRLLIKKFSSLPTFVGQK